MVEQDTFGTLLRELREENDLLNLRWEKPSDTMRPQSAD